MISPISLRGASDHVLEEVRMSRSINDSAVTFSGLKLPWSMPISSNLKCPSICYFPNTGWSDLPNFLTPLVPHQLHHYLLTWVLRIPILRSFWWSKNTWNLQSLTTGGSEETARNSLLREWKPRCCTWHHQFIYIRKVGDHWQPRG